MAPFPCSGSRHRSSGTALPLPSAPLLLVVLSALLCTLLPHDTLAQPLNTVNNIEHDTESERTRRGMIGYTGFVFDFFTGTRAEPSANGFQVPVNSNTNAFVHTLTDHGNALNFLHLGPCAGNSPHTHPRGSEISSIVRGRIQFGFVEENGPDGNRLVVVDASAGQVVFIPQGLMHFSHNLNCEPAAFIANFGNRDPGTQTVWSALMAIPTPILAASLNIANTQDESERIINVWKKRQFVHAPSTGGAQCLQKCGIDYWKANGFEPSQFDRENRLRLKFGPIVPTDQLGNKQNFSAGAMRMPSNRRDFVGFTSIPKTAGFDFLPAMPFMQGGDRRRLMANAAESDGVVPSSTDTSMTGGLQQQEGLLAGGAGGMDDNLRVQATIRKLESVLPKDRITVLDAKDIAVMEGDE